MEREWKELQDEAQRQSEVLDNSSTSTSTQKNDAQLLWQQRRAEFARIGKKAEAYLKATGEQLNLFITRWKNDPKF
jgi:hypothetical protein